MVMDLSNSGFFKAYLRSLRDSQLAALDEWNSTRLAENPDDKEVVADALSKKRIIYRERRRRGKH
jgi:hypothetical protein